MLRPTALVLLAASAAGFSSTPSRSYPSLPLLDGRTSANPSEICTCDQETAAGFSCKVLDASPTDLNWCINRCYPFYIDGDDHPCVIANISALGLACDNFLENVNGQAVQWGAIITSSTGQAPEDFCASVADAGCPEVVNGRIQIGPVDDQGFSTRFCGGIELEEGQQCSDFFGYYSFADEFIYTCTTAANGGCVGLGQDARQYCGGPPLA